MQSHQNRPDYLTVDDPSFSSKLSSGSGAGTAISVLEPYTPPNAPHGLPHVVQFTTLSSIDLPLEVRFLIVMIARFADVNGLASVANSTLCEICRIESHHTVERWISLAPNVGILQKEPGKGGNDRRNNNYTLLGADRNWSPLPVDRPGANLVGARAHASLVELLQARAAQVDGLEANTALLRRELALLRNGHTNSYYGGTNWEDEPPTGPPGDSYDAADPHSFQEAHGAVGQPGAPNGPRDNPPVEELVMAGRSPRFPRTIRFQTAMPVAGQQCPGVCQGCE